MRRLSAIMFTDMVGYSKLSQTNEALALDLLDEHRKLLRPFFDKFQGREIETAGDSFFVEFNSAVEATNCAIEIQTALHERNKIAPNERQILVRIGLHIGDVVYMENHVHGDGVNIAARMEPLAPAGGICISEDVTRQIRNKVQYPIVQLGAEKLKNISMPMNIYSVALPWITTPKSKKLDPRKKMQVAGVLVLAAAVIAASLFLFQPKKQNATPLFSKVRLAVLPLANISNNASDEFFADGMTEELISSLSKIGGLNVIARTSVMKYKATNKDITQISRELMVGTILEGSVRKIANKARITVQLIDASTQEHIWSMDYDREIKDIFKIQSEIASNVANELKVRLLSSEKEQLAKSQTQNTAAFQENLEGKHFLNKRTPDNIRIAVKHFQAAIAQDSAYALPYANLAYCYTLLGVAGYGDLPIHEAAAKAHEAADKALSIDPTLAEAHAALGYIKFRIDWDWEGAEQSLKKAIQLNPSYATAHEWYALFLAVQSRLDQSLEQMKLAYQLDPLSSNVNTGLARVYHFRKENELSIEQVEKAISLDTSYAEAHFTAGMTYYQMKDYPKAKEELLKAARLSGRRPVIIGMLGMVYVNTNEIDEARSLLAELQSPPMNNDKLYATAIIKMSIKEYDEAFDIFDKLLEEKYGILVYLKVQKDFFKATEDPRYAELLRKMGLE